MNNISPNISVLVIKTRKSKASAVLQETRNVMYVLFTNEITINSYYFEMKLPHETNFIFIYLGINSYKGIQTLHILVVTTK